MMEDVGMQDVHFNEVSVACALRPFLSLVDAQRGGRARCPHTVNSRAG